MRIGSYLARAQDIINQYQYPEPFHLFIKKYFSKFKFLGSRDRKIISALCYGYFRIGPQPNLSLEMAMQLGVWLSAVMEIKWYSDEFFFPRDKYKLSLEDKLNYLKDINIELTPKVLLPLSKNLSINEYAYDMLYMHNTGIRIRKHKDKFQKQAADNNVIINWVSDSIGTVPPNIDLASLFNEPNDYVIQDATSAIISSQLTAINYAKVWDCCAASGGKSLALLDGLSSKKHAAQLYVSDVRPQILKNLQIRLSTFGYLPYKVFVHDATRQVDRLNKEIDVNYFDTIIADVPCSGSGTWARTPEQFYFATNDAVLEYANKQKNILQNIWPFLKSGGTLYYITCSVFDAENETQINNWLPANAVLVSQQLVKGISYNSDTMYYAVITKK
jgi:16S rRNA (cytosine967-C5)-methyltransferase